MISTTRIKLPPCTCSYSIKPFSTSSSSLAAYNYTSLKSTRSILNINGVDSVKFLQGLISNDVKRISSTGERLLYAAMLKADGRMLHDVFISSSESPIPSSPTSFYIDHASSDTTTLRTYLKRHILRSKVKLGKEAEERTIYTAWKTTGEEEGTAEESKEAEEWFAKNEIGKDVRMDEMGWRWSTSNTEPISPPSSSFKEVPASHHHLHRLLQAIPENPIDWPTLPLEGNLDYMNGVDYKKGCYVGQELTARTHHRGVVRKRGVVLRLFREGDEVPTSILPQNETALPSSTPLKYPLPSPQSTLTKLGSSTTASRVRARPSGKLGSSLSITTSSGLETVLAFGSVRLEHIEEGDAVFVVKEPVIEVDGSTEVEVSASEEVKVVEKEEGRWLAKAFIPEWIMEKKKEDARKADEE